MVITKKHLSRRAILRGAGAAMALPLLDAMVPALTAQRATAAAPVRRFGAIFVGNGMNMSLWTPAKDGPLELPPLLAQLVSFRDRLVVVSGLGSKPAEGQDAGPHARAQTSWLTGARARRTEGADIQAGVSMDQIAAKVLGAETQIASLGLAIESTDLLGACNLGYSCAYLNTISWRTSTTPLPMENNPRAVFERLFGASASTDAQTRLLDARRRRSVLDDVNNKIVQLRRTLGPADRSQVDEYVDAVRDVERRIQIMEDQAHRELPAMESPQGIPATFEEHVATMFDLQALAYQCDLTRVATFLMLREASVRSFPEVGVPDSYHPLSHHQNDPEKLARQAKVNAFHLKLFARFLARLGSTPDGDGSVLDHTLLLYGSGMSDSNLHMPANIPTLLVGGPALGLQGGRHLRYPEGTPLASLQLALLDKLGVHIDQFGNSSSSPNPMEGL